MYARLCEAAAGDPFVLDLLDLARPGQARPVLLLAAVQRVLFDAPDDPLARFYPSVSGRAGARRATRRRPSPPSPASTPTTLGEMIATALDADQRGEPAAWRWPPGCGRPPPTCPDTPLALVELGPSAGLNLLADTYADRRRRRRRPPATGVARACCGPRLVGERSPGRSMRRCRQSSPGSGSTCTRSMSGPTTTRCAGWRPACGPSRRERLERFRAAVVEARGRPAPAGAGRPARRPARPARRPSRRGPCLRLPLVGADLRGPRRAARTWSTILASGSRSPAGLVVLGRGARRGAGPSAGRRWPRTVVSPCSA